MECSGFSHPCMQSRKWNENRWQNLIFWGMCIGKIPSGKFPSGWEVIAPAYLWTTKNVLRGWPLSYPCLHSSCLTHNQTEVSLSKASSRVWGIPSWNFISSNFRIANSLITALRDLLSQPGVWLSGAGAVFTKDGDRRYGPCHWLQRNSVCNEPYAARLPFIAQWFAAWVWEINKHFDLQWC